MNIANEKVPNEKLKYFKLIKGLFIFVAISGCFSVLFGAWLAHAGQALPDDVIFRLSNALQYQFIHTLALFIVLSLNQLIASKWLVLSASCFSLGILLFSGSLYLKTLLGVDALGQFAPFGGVTLAIAWLLLAFFSHSLVKNK